MFRLSRNKGAKSGDRVEFKFSDLKAIQVPKGWDKLFVSIVSVETGKTITKSSKAVVRNGSCEWMDILSESIWSPQNESSKEVDGCLFKFIVAMGSARSGILGEATVNMTGYISSTASVSASLPLKKNNYGTVLQVTIHCMAQRIKVRDGESRDSNNSLVEDLKADSSASDVKSEVSDSVSPHSVASSSSKARSSASHPGEPESRQTSFSASGSHDSYDSPDIFLSREALSPTTTNVNGNVHNLRHDSSSSRGNYLVDDASQAHQSSFASPTSLRISNSSKNLLEAAEDAIEELRAEAKMWERNARKLMLDLDMLREEFSNQSKNQANLEMELSATRAECNGLIKEVERLKLSSEKPKVTSSLEDEDAVHLQKEMENEIKVQRESSADLATLLKRSQESNIELMSLLQELELEKSVVQSKANDLENTLDQVQVKVQMLEHALEDKSKTVESKLENHLTEMGIAEMEALKEKVQELETDCNELTDENLELLFKLKELNNLSIGVCTSCTNVSHKVSDDGYDSSFQELESSKMELESIVTELRSEISKLEANLVSKDEGIAELEAKVANLENQNIHLEENTRAVARESDITSKCLNGLQNDLAMLSSSVDTHVSANKILERKSSELETERNELQLRLVELEEENVQLVDCISSLEAQQRHLTDESESGRFELERFRSLAEDLQDEITRLKNGMEIQKCSEVEECEYLKRSNLALQATAEKLNEERSTLRKLNVSLGEQNVELNERCAQLEAKLRESNKNFSDFSEKVEILEENLSSALEDIAFKEKTLMSELDALKEKLAVQETLFGEMHLAKSVEIENLREQVHYLSEKVSEAMHEAACLREEKCKIEAYAQEKESKLKHTENELNVINLKSDEKVEGLRAELSSSKQHRIKLLADHEKVVKLLEKYKLNEENLIYQQSTIILEKEKLEDSLERISSECKELKAENISLAEKISTLEEKLLQAENNLIEKEALCIQEADLRNELNRISRTNSQFQRKIQQLEKDKDECLTKSHTLEDELKTIKKAQSASKTNARVSPAREDMKISRNEMARSPKSPNHLRDSRKKLSSKNDQVQELTKSRQKPHKEGSNGSGVHDQLPQSVDSDSFSKIQLLENELAKAMEANKSFKAQLNRLKLEGQNQHHGGEVVAKERFERTKSSLETELKDIRERYLHMSLQYAEVEAQREELVMKLKAAKNGKRWFS